MNWAIGLWAAYGIFTILVFITAWFGLRYMQKTLLDSKSDKE